MNNHDDDVHQDNNYDDDGQPENINDYDAYDDNDNDNDAQVSPACWAFLTRQLLGLAGGRWPK